MRDLLGRKRRREDRALGEWCRTTSLVITDPDWPSGPAPLVNVHLDTLRLMIKYGGNDGSTELVPNVSIVPDV